MFIKDHHGHTHTCITNPPTGMILGGGIIETPETYIDTGGTCETPHTQQLRSDVWSHEVKMPHRQADNNIYEEIRSDIIVQRETFFFFTALYITGKLTLHFT